MCYNIIVGNSELNTFPLCFPLAHSGKHIFLFGGDYMLRKKMSGSTDKAIFKKTAKSSKAINYVTVKRGGIRL